MSRNSYEEGKEWRKKKLINVMSDSPVSLTTSAIARRLREKNKQWSPSTTTVAVLLKRIGAYEIRDKRGPNTWSLTKPSPPRYDPSMLQKREPEPVEEEVVEESVEDEDDDMIIGLDNGRMSREEIDSWIVYFRDPYTPDTVKNEYVKQVVGLSSLITTPSPSANTLHRLKICSLFRRCGIS